MCSLLPGRWEIAPTERLPAIIDRIMSAGAVDVVESGMGKVATAGRNDL